MAVMKTPGVYIVEKNAFSNSVVEVDTAVPAFVGYTQKATNAGAPLLMRPFRITSMAEFERFFGGAPAPRFTVSAMAAVAGNTGPAPDGVAAVKAAKTLTAAQKASDRANTAAAEASKTAAMAVIGVQMAEAAKTAADDAVTAKTGPETTAAGLVEPAKAKLETAVADAAAAKAADKEAAETKRQAAEDEYRIALDADVAAKADKAIAEQVQEAAKKQLQAAKDAAAAAEADKATASGAKIAADAVLAAAANANGVYAKIAEDAAKAAAEAKATALAAMTDDDKKAAAEQDDKDAAKATEADNRKPPADSDFSVKLAGVDVKYAVQDNRRRHRLYYAMKHFFQNGGGACHIVSVGDYDDAVGSGPLMDGIEKLKLEQEPTMVVIPDAVSLDDDGACFKVQQAMLKHCGADMKNRIAILDVYDGDTDLTDPNNCVSRFRVGVGKNQLDFGAAYYPWVHTSIIEPTDVSFTSFQGIDLEATFLPAVPAKPDVDPYAELREILATKAEEWTARKAGGEDIAPLIADADKALYQASADYVTMLKSATKKLNVMPPSAAMAGLYTMVDNSRGVWKAPANVSVNSVTSPAVSISHDQQQDLNVHAQGKSINAIRAFIGEGVLVWGARTLDGNSLDWRYINVRRTMIMLEESCRLAAKAMVFEPNVAGTWLSIKSMIQNFLNGVWKRGGLAGGSPDDAFSVFCGLGETMTPEDILEGILKVTVLVAISRPAEFIEITFQQQMQKS